MADIKNAFAGLKEKIRVSETSQSIIADEKERGLSTYEEFLRATKYLKDEKNVPLKHRDLAKIIRLEKLVQHIQADLQEEVTAYRQLYPEITHQELSQRALDLRIEKQRREAQEIIDRQKRWEEADRLKNELALIKQRQDEELVKRAECLIQELSLVQCSSCKDGREKSICVACEGTGRVAPYVRLVSKPVVGCCHKPTCAICAGTNMYYRDQWETSTVCASDGCIGGFVLVPCSKCLGTRVSPSTAESLPHALTTDFGLIENIKSLIFSYDSGLKRNERD